MELTVTSTAQQSEFCIVHYCCLFLSPSSIVSRGDWLGKPANFKVENSGTVGYVGSSLMPCNPLFLFTN